MTLEQCQEATLASQPPDLRPPEKSRDLVVSVTSAIRTSSTALTPAMKAREDLETIPSRALVLALEYARGFAVLDVTAQHCGDPSFERSALYDKLREAQAKKDKLMTDAFVEGYMGGMASDEDAFPPAFTSFGPAYKAGWLKGRQNRSAAPPTISDYDNASTQP